ncbi:hypothetical protein MIND_01231900 [Mycena indigotica]|uniref:Uncharacterized protein n=1 Tax=Mycena indigotica TaxID=2126181 RepID=A0A8H6S498_9AGAR|nr:uncharacterized protein MIND_01231900 [Mycena indigotica]KAF7292058.1 hypothetical protein MIND_01231900 [Mycena indigotica]
MPSEKPTKEPPTDTERKMGITWDVPVLFGIMFILSTAELGFSVDTFQYKQKTHTWDSSTERSRIAFLIFSSVRTMALSSVYIGFHFAQKVFGSMHHSIFVVLSTIFWIVSGVLIHTLFGLIECGGVGRIQGGLNECHELKIIEVLSWVLAGMSVVSAVPVVMRALDERKHKLERKQRLQGGKQPLGHQIV